MAGGITTTELVVAVSEAGALGSIGAGYMTPEALHQQIKEIKNITPAPFSVNLFVPNEFTIEEERIRRAKQVLKPLHDTLGITDEETTLPTYEQSLKTFQESINIIIE